jgi:hypothetical protein
LAPDVAVRLTATKQLLLEGDSLAMRRDEAGRLQAVLLLDLAVETALKLLLPHVGLQVKSKMDFPLLLSSAADHITIPPDVNRLHNVRNGAQHQGLSPAVEEMPAWRAAAEALARAVFTKLGAEYDRFTLVELVVNPDLSEPLRIAEAAAAANPGPAIAVAAHAFHRLRGMVEELIGPAAGLEMWVFPTPRFADHQQQVNCADGRDDAVAASLRVLSWLGMGADPMEQVRLVRLASGRVAGVVEGEWRAGEEPGLLQVAKPSEADALWAIDFVARQAVRLERVYPEITAMGPGYAIARDSRVERARFLPVASRGLGQR